MCKNKRNKVMKSQLWWEQWSGSSYTQFFNLSWVVPLRIKNITIFREEATSALVCFHMTSILAELEFGLLVFVEGGKPENPEKNHWSKARTNDKLNPHMAPGGNRTWATLVGGEHSHHCAIPASP